MKSSGLYTFLCTWALKSPAYFFDNVGFVNKVFTVE